MPRKSLHPVRRSAIFAFVNFYCYFRYFRQVIKFHRKIGYFPNIANPKKYNEKFIWRKIFDRNPLFAVFCDKLATKDYVGSLIPEITIPKTLWSGTRLDFPAHQSLGPMIVLKANHGSSLNLFPADLEKGFDEVKRETDSWMSRDYWKSKMETGYRGARKLIFAEELLRGDSPIIDVSVRAANGMPILVSCITDNKTSGKKVGYFSCAGERLPEEVERMPKGNALDRNFKPPASIRKCVEYAATLSKDVDYARYDFIVVDDKVFAGEITVYPAGGLSTSDKNGKLGIDPILNRDWDIATSHFFSTRSNPFLERYKAMLKECV